jgi:hypothetical protein
MELKDVITVVVIFMFFTLLITILKMRGGNKTGYKSMTFHSLFRLKVGFQKVEGSRTFCMIVDNESEQDVMIKDMYLEIKKGSRYQKVSLPAGAFDNTNIMTIPAGKSGASFVKPRDFHTLFTEDSLLKAVVEDQNGKSYKSNILVYKTKKKELDQK